MFKISKNVYDEDFKRSIVSLYQNSKTQTQLSKDYGISLSAINKWVKQYSEIKTEDGDVFTAKQIKEIQKKKRSIRRKSNFKKGDCHLHSTLKQRLNAIFTLRNQHNIKLLCKIFNVNRSTY